MPPPAFASLLLPSSMAALMAVLIFSMVFVSVFGMSSVMLYFSGVLASNEYGLMTCM